MWVRSEFEWMRVSVSEGESVSVSESGRVRV